MIKKALSISIAQTLFSIEEDAYARLDSYLESVRAHFEHTEGRDEIIADIESRIAEQLGESKEQVISLATVEKVLAQMGKTEDFDDEETARSHTETGKESGSRTAPKRLYRNPDDKLLAGVASGLAAYVGIEPVWMRLLFAVATFFNGLGLIVYLVLWLVVPEAKTRAQKLEMAGSPVNLETISETVRERVAEIPVDKSGMAKILALPFRIIGGVMTFLFSILGPVLRISMGAVLTLGSMLALVGVLVASSFVSSKELWISHDTPLQAILPQPLYFFGLLGIAVAVAVPLIFILLGGISLLQRKSVVNAATGLGLAGVWFVALALSGFTLVTGVANYQEFVSNSPAYAQTTQAIPVEGDFTALKVSHGVDVEIVSGTTVSLRATGRVRDMELVSARVENGTLVLDRVTPSSQKMWCIACGAQTPRLTLEVPGLSEISLSRGASAYSTALPVRTNVTLALTQGSYADIALTVRNLTISALDGSRLSLKGAAASAEVSLDNGSFFEGESLVVEEAIVTVSDGSRAHMNISETLEATATRGSSVMYSGKPDVTPFADRSSRISGLVSEEVESE